MDNKFVVHIKVVDATGAELEVEVVKSVGIHQIARGLKIFGK